MLSDYKIVSMRQDGAGTTAIVRIYEGMVTTKDEMNNETKAVVPVTRYRRSAMVKQISVNHTSRSEKDIRDTCNKELTKDRKRTPLFTVSVST